MTHAHITTWVIAIILFFVANSLLKSGKEKVVHMVLRLFYILIIVTGVIIASGIYQFNGEYIGKIILGIVTIGMMEMVLVKAKKGQPNKVFWIIFIISLILTILLGLRLPLGFSPLG
ncbi:YisL family protein [uncultured Metabacillus sp.]|uniref:YisL family protein n=1 Tax=uncultured Metabacillus sp. TaxID=2860135 RepID=UPI0026122086|nr:YisL family protein [uncultured Metabacillus sp.]